MENLKKTPLFDQHVAHGAKMVPFAGYEMPVQYAGVSHEHHVVRSKVGMFDVSHMGEFSVKGPGALALIQKITTNDASKLFDGKVQYSSLILTKQMTRDDALEKLKTLPYNEATIKDEFEYIATKLGISVAELEGYLNAPNRSNSEFKSQQSMYSIGAKVMRMLGLEKGGKR